MSDTAWDAVGYFDEDTGTGEITRFVGAMRHISISANLWPGARAAAALGQSDFNAWVANSPLPAAVRATYAGLSAEEKAAYRKGALGLSP